ncbi:MAG: MurR/RpiR family transcriptional regulator, partial [Deltaproteobacteria bacterium]|nr:MurR/RpiR family transcriptional regulator [Deltaproteobacteria bacterium]
MDLAKLTKTVLDENLALLAHLDAEQVARFVEELQHAKRIFCSAQGR